MKRRAALAGAFFLLAPAIALHAQVTAGNPVPAWAEAWNGFTLADKSLTSLKTGQSDEGTLDISIGPEAERIAKVAYTKEPLAVDSHFALALANADEREELLRLSRLIDKRSRLTAIVLLQKAAERQDLNELMQLADEITRLEPQIGTQIVSVLSDSLEYRDSVPLLRDALLEDPAWAPAFWRSVPASEVALDRFLLLRRELEPQADVQAVRNLIATLVNRGRFADAFQIYSDVRNATDIANGADTTGYPPIDWELAKGRDFQARRTAAGEFEFFVEANSSGQLARKLVSLSPGKFGLTGPVSVLEGSGELIAQLECVEGPTPDNWNPAPLGAQPRWQVMPQDCDFAWLEIRGATWDSSLALRARVAGMKFGPVETAQR